MTFESRQVLTYFDGEKSRHFKLFYLSNRGYSLGGESKAFFANPVGGWCLLCVLADWFSQYGGIQILLLKHFMANPLPTTTTCLGRPYGL